MAFTLHAGTPPLDPRLAQVLEYWLGAEQPTDASALARKQLWFTKDEAVDEEIRHRFGAVMQEALAGRLNDDAATPLGRLAVIIVLDQFMRNAHRGTPKSFAGDPLALQLALDTQPVKALLLVPTLSNPLGSCMPQAERKRLVQLAQQHQLPVIEDAIYADLAEGDAMRRTLKSYDSAGLVMLCHSFSKTLAPGLRLGWLEAGRWSAQVRHLKEMQAGGQSPVLELALADLVTQAGHAAAMRQLRAAIAVRVDQVRQVIAQIGRAHV